MCLSASVGPCTTNLALYVAESVSEFLIGKTNCLPMKLPWFGNFSLHTILNASSLQMSTISFAFAWSNRGWLFGLSPGCDTLVGVIPGISPDVNYFKPVRSPLKSSSAIGNISGAWYYQCSFEMIFCPSFSHAWFPTILFKVIGPSHIFHFSVDAYPLSWLKLIFCVCERRRFSDCLIFNYADILSI